MHILIRMYVCFFQGSGFWLSKIWETSMPHLPYLQLHIKPIRSRMWRKATLMPWWGTIHFWAIREYHLRNSDFLLKNLQNLRIDSWSRYEWLCTCYITILSLNRPRLVKLYALHIRWKVRTLPTCSTLGRVLCCMFAISWEYNIVATPDQPT